MSFNEISDFRSDTVTRPTEEMRKAMYNAEVGDDVHGDDPTVNRLEEMAAEIMGKEAALFVPSGTMGNTIALILGAGEGKEVILEEKCHILNFESGNISRIARSVPRALRSRNGKIPISDITANIHCTLREHMTVTKAIALENTHNIWGGTILEPAYLAEVAETARKYGLYFHLDGARVFNAAVGLNINVKEIVKYFDSVMFCLSKGLSAPVGSMLTGSKEFIKEARFVRKYLGGGMRQVGIIASAGIVALQTMIDRLKDDHRRARQLAERIMDLDALEIDIENVQTNMVLIHLKNMKSDVFLERLTCRKVWALPLNEHDVRLVTHKDIDDDDVEKAVIAIRDIMC